MAVVTVELPAGSTPAGASPRLIAGAIVLDLPWWPDLESGSGEPANWNEIERPGRTPLLVRQSEGLAERRVSMIVANRSRDGKHATSVDASCMPTLTKLSQIVNHLQPVSLIMGGRNTGKWRVIDYSYNALTWTASGDISSAEVSLTFKTASDATVPVGPIKKRK